MATLLPNGKQSYEDATGAPLVGGKLRTFDAGTNNPRPTFADAAGTVPNLNPVILDGRGEAVIFWSGRYKVELLDANDAIIWTVDDVIGAGDLLTEQLASDSDAAGGGGAVGFNQALNYVARTIGASLQDRGIELLNFVTDQAERAAIKAGTSTTDHTSIFVIAFVLAKKVYANEGKWNISEFQTPVHCMLEGAGPYSTTIYVSKAPLGFTNKGIFLRELAGEAESGIVLKNFSLEAKDWASVGKHSYGLDIANIAHAYVENVHATGFERGFYLEDSLINTFVRCRVHANHIGLYIDGTEPGAGGPGASKNLWLDLKCTSNGNAVDGGGGILLTGASAYQNVFINPDIEFNYTAISVDGSFDGPHIFIAPYFEGNSANPDNGNLIRTMAGTWLVLDRPIAGNTGPGTAAGYLDPNFNNGTVEIRSGHSNSQATRWLPPKFGTYEMAGSGGHDVASTSLLTMIDYWKTFTPIAQAGSVISGPAALGFIYGAASGGSATIRNTFDSDPNNTANWTAPNGTMGQADPIGGLTAVALTGNFRMQRSVGFSTGPVTCQAFVKVVAGVAGEFQMIYTNNGIVRAVRSFSFAAGQSGWMLVTLDFDLTGQPSTNTQHDMQIVDAAGKIHLWWPQIVQGTRLPQPILPLDGGGQKFSAGTGIPANFSTALRMVGVGSYELPKIVKRVSYNGGGGTTAQFPPLVDALTTAAGKVFELVIREVITSTTVISVYNVSLSFQASTTTALSIKLVSQSVMGGGLPSRVTPSVPVVAVNTEKTVLLTNSDVVIVEATIREIT